MLSVIIILMGIDIFNTIPNSQLLLHARSWKAQTVLITACVPKGCVLGLPLQRAIPFAPTDTPVTRTLLNPKPTMLRMWTSFTPMSTWAARTSEAVKLSPSSESSGSGWFTKANLSYPHMLVSMYVCRYVGRSM